MRDWYGDLLRMTPVEREQAMVMAYELAATLPARGGADEERVQVPDVFFKDN